MKIVEKICEFFKRLLKKDQEIKRIDEPVKKIKKEDSSNFISSLKDNVVQNNTKRKRIKTLICEGDGLGIQSKIEG